MKVKDLKNVLNQMDPDEEIIFSLEMIFENEFGDVNFTIDKEEININNTKVIKTYEEGIYDIESDYDKQLHINLYTYVPYEDYREE